MIVELENKRKSLFNSTLYNYWLDRGSEIRALVSISTSDNYDEYVWMYNLEGIEGFCLKHWAYGLESFDVNTLTDYKIDSLKAIRIQRTYSTNDLLPKLTRTRKYQKIMNWFNHEKFRLEEKGIIVNLT